MTLNKLKPTLALGAATGLAALFSGCATHFTPYAQLRAEQDNYDINLRNVSHETSPWMQAGVIELGRESANAFGYERVAVVADPHDLPAKAGYEQVVKTMHNGSATQPTVIVLKPGTAEPEVLKADQIEPDMMFVLYVALNEAMTDIEQAKLYNDGEGKAPPRYLRVLEDNVAGALKWLENRSLALRENAPAPVR